MSDNRWATSTSQYESSALFKETQQAQLAGVKILLVKQQIPLLLAALCRRLQLLWKIV